MRRRWGKGRVVEKSERGLKKEKRNGVWGVHKKVFHKSEDKMHKKMKMTSQRAENLVYVQQHHGKSLHEKCFLNIAFYS